MKCLLRLNLFAIFAQFSNVTLTFAWIETEKTAHIFKFDLPSHPLISIIFSAFFYFERVPPTKTKHVYLSFVSCGHPSQIKPARVHKLRCNLQQWYHQSLWKALCNNVSNCKAKATKLKIFLRRVTCYIAKLLSYYKQQSNLL